MSKKPPELIGHHIEPDWEADVPLCTSTCRQWDGKRCQLLGSQPSTLCEPAVEDVVIQLRSYQEYAKASEGA